MDDYSKIEVLSKLQDNWDGDDADAPSSEAINRARSFLDVLKRPPDDIDADALGGVVFWFYFDSGCQIMIGFYNENDRSILCHYKNETAIPKINVFSNYDEFLMYINCISLLK